MYIDQGHKVKTCLEASSVRPSSYYYKSNGNRKGKHASKYTKKCDGSVVRNSEIVEQIRQLLSHEFVDYGYIKVTHWLRKRRGYIINKKKVYRLMKAHKLLNPKREIQRQPRLWVKELVPQPDGVFEHLEIDIKYLHVPGRWRHVMQLTVLDIKSRYVLGYMQGYSIRKEDVIRLFEQIFALIKMPESYYIRCDNGSQFTANEVRSYFDKHSHAQQEFTRPATPEQNGHIEAFHSIIQRTICQRFQFEDVQDLQQTMARFIKFYNTDRIHSGIDYECPLYEVRKHRPLFKPVWVADYSMDNPLLSIQSQGLAIEESEAGGQQLLINGVKRICSSF